MSLIIILYLKSFQQIYLQFSRLLYIYILILSVQCSFVLPFHSFAFMDVFILVYIFLVHVYVWQAQTIHHYLNISE